MRLGSYTLGALALFAFGGSALTAELPVSHGCLYAVNEGPDNKPVLPCEDKDPLNHSNNLDIKNVITALGLGGVTIKFKGCENSRFFVSDDDIGTSENRQYTIHYPYSKKEKGDDHIAPITHELAHVLQMEISGGIDALRKEIPESKRVELGADHLAGVIFRQTLTHIHINTFQHNLSLIGKYVELDVGAHGKPQERGSAFRWGAFLDFDKFNRNIRSVNDDFQANVYGQIANVSSE